jgi:hypothetical protein
MERKAARHWLAIVLAGCTLLWGLAACRLPRITLSGVLATGRLLA